MSTTKIPASTLQFLKALDANNNRDWFQEHKDEYVDEHTTMVAFADDLLAEMNKVDQIETASGKKSLMRIYRDVRFSKNKSPYKNNFGGGLKRASKLLRGGYYYHIQPGQSFVGGGFWGPNADDLKRIREEFAQDDHEIRSIINDPTFVELFGELKGDGVKTAPKGFSKDHEAIDLIRKKQFIVMRPFTDKAVQQADFLHEVVRTFQGMRPFFDYMSDVLTTDANGNPLFEN